MTRNRCTSCLIIFDDEYLGENGECPICNKVEDIVKTCNLDHSCTCISEIHETVKMCDECGEAMCPECGSHDVAQISRVTGYLQEVNGWNKGKQQELKDRFRVTI